MCLWFYVCFWAESGALFGFENGLGPPNPHMWHGLRVEMPHEVGAFGLFSAGSQLLERGLVHSWCSLYESVLSRFSHV